MAITERKRKDGTIVYDARVFMGYKRDGSVDRRCVTCRTKRTAQIEEAKMIAERDALRGRSSKMTLSQYIDNYYWPVTSKRLSPTSLDTYEQEIRLRIRPALGDTDIRKIDRDRIQRMVDDARTDGIARKAVSVLKTILNEARGDGLIQSNPSQAKFAWPSVKSAKRDNGVVLQTFDQIADMLEYIRDNCSQSLQRIAYTGLLQGMRPEERYALDWSDIDIYAGTISITKAYVTASDKHGGKQIKETKTARSNRVIPMHPDFKSWVEQLPRSSTAFIVNDHGERISPSTMQHRWARFLAENPTLPQVTIENMRHSFATAYLAAGGRVEVLSRLLGHSNIQTTINRYYKPEIATIEADMRRVYWQHIDNGITSHGLDGPNLEVRFSAPPPLT